MNPLDARRRLLGRNVYKRTTEGNPAIAQGSLARRYPGITMQGWTEQAQYEGNQLFDKSGIVLTSAVQYISVNVGDGEFTLSTNYIAPSRNDVFFLPGNVNTGASGLRNGVQHGTSRTVTSENGYVTVALRLSSDGTASPLDYQIMLNEGSTALPYEPYTGGQPSPNPDYPQEITSAGKYNEDTQKWEYEITIANAQTDPDKNQTVLLTSDRPLTKWDKLEKRNGQWGWVYKSAEVVLDGSEDEDWVSQIDANRKIQFYITLSDALYLYSDPFKKMFYCNTFFTTNAGGAIPNWQVRRGTYNGLAPVFKPSDDIDTVELFRNFLAENQTTILYVTKEETFIPLSESEQEAMNALYTFRPTTVLSNDCECEMTLTYKTKKSLEVTT